MVSCDLWLFRAWFTSIGKYVRAKVSMWLMIEQVSAINEKSFFKITVDFRGQGLHLLQASWTVTARPSDCKFLILAHRRVLLLLTTEIPPLIHSSYLHCHCATASIQMHCIWVDAKQKYRQARFTTNRKMTTSVTEISETWTTGDIRGIFCARPGAHRARMHPQRRHCWPFFHSPA